MGTTNKPELAFAAAILTLPVRDAARAIGISERYAWELIASGELPALRLGRRRLVRVESISKFLAAREAETE